MCFLQVYIRNHEPICIIHNKTKKKKLPRYSIDHPPQTTIELSCLLTPHTSMPLNRCLVSVHHPWNYWPYYQKIKNAMRSVFFIVAVLAVVAVAVAAPAEYPQEFCWCEPDFEGRKPPRALSAAPSNKYNFRTDAGGRQPWAYTSTIKTQQKHFEVRGDGHASFLSEQGCLSMSISSYMRVTEIYYRTHDRGVWEKERESLDAKRNNSRQLTKS